MKASQFLIAAGAAFGLSFVGLCMVPNAQFGNLQPFVDEEAGETYPNYVSGVAEQGRDVYVSQGCVYCHTQAVRSPANGADIERGWGVRRSVARDFIYENPALGIARNGPDLANVGARITDEDWHYRHLYNPRSVSPSSYMPAFKHLFEKRRISGQPSADALELKGSDMPPAGYEIVPKPEAKALVGYLLSLDRSFSLKEAPAPKKEEAQ